MDLSLQNKLKHSSVGDTVWLDETVWLGEFHCEKQTCYDWSQAVEAVTFSTHLTSHNCSRIISTVRTSTNNRTMETLTSTARSNMPKYIHRDCQKIIASKQFGQDHKNFNDSTNRRGYNVNMLSDGILVEAETVLTKHKEAKANKRNLQTESVYNKSEQRNLRQVVSLWIG